MSLRGLKAAVVGGDARELEIVRLMLDEGMEVKATGLPPGAEAILGKAQATTAAEAIAGAQVVVCPIPGLGMDDSIYAPHWPEKIYIRPEELETCLSPGLVVMGTASPAFASMVQGAGMRLREYEQDDELMILRSRAIAEGALGLAIQNTQETLHKSRVFIIGFGRVAITLTGVLLALRADVTVAARNAAQLARAWEMGAEPLHLSKLAEHIGSARVIFSSVPALVVDRNILERTDPDALIMDLVAPPGSVDFAAAKGLGRRAIWARGLGSRAPVSVGRSQWKGVRAIICQEMGLQD